MSCPHCGSTHAQGIAFCPATGKPVAATQDLNGAGRSGAVDPVGILTKAFQLYKNNARALLIAAGVALVPIYVLHAGLAAALLPGRGVAADMEARDARMQQRSQELQRRMQAGTLTSAEAARAEQQILQDANKNLSEAGGALASTGLFFLSLLLLIPLSVLGTFFGTAAIIPLVEDRASGGAMTAREAWNEVGRRAVPLAITGLAAAVAVMIGLFCFVVPGIVLGFLFAFAAPVVMLEGTSGVAALKRSARLVIAHWLPAAVVLIALAVLSAVARFAGGLLLPDRWVFLHTLVRDAFSLVVFPLPVAGLVLLFREARKSPAQSPALGQPLAAH